MSEEIKIPHHHNNEDEEQNIISMMPDEDTLTAVASAMKQLGDPTRLRIFWLLCHAEECVLNIAYIVGMTSPAVSHHLKLLKSAGLVETRREGKEMYYRAADTPLVDQLHHTIEAIADIACPGC